MLSNQSDELFIHQAIELAKANISNGGGPFGAIIVKNGAIIASGANRVTASCDPTAHAEVMAIREASQKLQTWDLCGCTIYSSCEPCPMCLSACYWAHVDRIVYAALADDAKQAGFDDAFIYNEFQLPVKERKIVFENMQRNQAKEVFSIWIKTENKIKY